ncbi:NrtA/SsuA/CpmA family ABC transporter substrate-binding protein [Roseomonas sp. GC11]|uniref:NrtA/SsuA/CpmA family ABC transporter substrate-binding protein n=1 Tax=Roseomonas sp. GC11 TaxID=2950546 RepID=UPI00210F0501|nr:NrtA/SsuA/CpmA family ABC transporter substrate-binding protein [Roseomonas sp. GC11]MCQ4159065.1 NrtA/SsuA/CpmA family ABC transporter substrate-binding protein [Roseomonas sp. GC11]
MLSLPFLSRRAVLGTGLAAAGTLAGHAALAQGRRTTDTVRLGWGFGGLPLLAKERGEFARLLARDGIKVEWIGPFPAHAPSIQAVVGGSADFSFGGSTTPALASIIAGSPLVFTQFAVVEPRTTAIIARRDSGITGIPGLKGRSVAVNRSGLGEFLLIAALEKHGLSRNDVRVVYLNPPEAAPAFAAGKVDAWSMWSPGVDIARSEYGAHDIFVEGRDLGFQIDFSSYLVTRRFAEQNTEIVRAVNAAYAAEAAWASENPREAETLAQRQGAYSDAIRDAFIERRRRYVIRRIDDTDFQAELQRAADWLSQRRVLPEPVRVRDHLARL